MNSWEEHPVLKPTIDETTPEGEQGDRETPAPSALESDSSQSHTSLSHKVSRFFDETLSQVSGFQPRRSQLEMALAVADCIENEDLAVIEAGTGTGKSLAYLVPLLLREGESDGPAIIATKTVQLQYQLLKKDLPILQELIATPRTVVQAKGWSNYACQRKVESPDEHAIRHLGPKLTDIRKGLLNQQGRLTRQETSLTRSEWDRIKADPLDCQKRHCPHFSQCGLFAERRELESAEIIITNHAFLLTDLRLRREGRGLLPPGDILIIDEAHRLDEVATEHLAVRFDPDRVFSCLTSPLLAGSDGWLAATRFTFLMTLPETDFQEWSARFDEVVLMNLRELDHSCIDIFSEAQAGIMESQQPRLPLKALLHHERGERLANLCSELCLGIDEAADQMTRLCRDYEEAFHISCPPELVRLAQSVARLGYDLQFLLECESDDWVYLLEADPPTLIARPVDNSESFRSELFSDYEAVVATSASLQVSGSFDFFKRRSGMDTETPTHCFLSPFEISKNTFVGLSTGGPPPNSREYPTYLARYLADLAIGLQGRMFVLTTSHRRVQEFSSLLRPHLTPEGIGVLAQGTESAAQMLRRFNSPGQHVLVGVDTFWEGVDIPGERLSCVVLTRLPFPVPSDELFKARCKKIESEGGRPFDDLSMPLVGLKLKQGFGRLLRRETDKGLFLLTDPRATEKAYGRRLLRDLPVAHAVKAPIQEIVGQALVWSRENLGFLRE